MSYAGPGRGVAKTVQTRFLNKQNMEFYLLWRFDAQTMVDNPKVSASTGMVDDGTGVKEVSTIKPQIQYPFGLKYPHLSKDREMFCLK